MEPGLRVRTHIEDIKEQVCKDEPLSQFESFLRRLDAHRDHAGQKYVELRHRLIRFFGWNDCFPEEDLADEVLDRVARKIESEEIHDLVPFIWGVARNIVREFHKRLPTVDIDNLPPHEDPHTGNPELPIIEATERQRRLRCLDLCTQGLSAAERELFLEYEYYTDKPQNTARLAERLGLTIGALQIKAHRIKHKVELCARKCFTSSPKTGLQVFKGRRP